MTTRRLALSLLPISILALALGVGTSSTLTGCGSSGDTGGGAADVCFDYAGFEAGAAVGFKADVLPIFRTSCGLSTSCHGSEGGGSDPAQHFLGPKNDAPEPNADQIDIIFAQIVEQDAVNNPGMLIVKPNEPESSFLMYKLDGAACDKLACTKGKSCGTDMPQPPSKQLDSSKRDIIRRWIKQGAKND